MTNEGETLSIGGGTSEDSKAPFVQLVVRVTPELHRQFHLAVLRRGKHGLRMYSGTRRPTMASVIREFIEDYTKGGDIHA